MALAPRPRESTQVPSPSASYTMSSSVCGCPSTV